MKFYITIITATLLNSLSIHAEEVTLIQPLDFGKVLVSPSRITSTITITSSGNTILTNQIWVIEEGHRAEFLLQNYPPNKTLNVNISIIDPLTQSSSGGDTQFIVKDIEFPTQVTTDGRGEAKVNIGGTLETTNNSQPYLNGNYQTKLDFQVSY